MTDRNCEQWLEDGTLERYVDGDLDDSAAASVETHLRDCSICQTEVEALQVERDLIQGALFSQVDSHPKVASLPQAIPTNPRNQPAFKSSIAAILAIAAAIVLFLGISPQSEESETSGEGEVLTLVQDDSQPSIELGSVEARPGEEVTLDLRVANLEGLSGLKAEVVFDPSWVTVVPQQSSLAQCGVKNDRVVIATLSQDAWKDQGGVAFRLPLVVRENAPSNLKIDLRIEAVQLSDKQATLLKPNCRDGAIKIL